METLVTLIEKRANVGESLLLQVRTDGTLARPTVMPTVLLQYDTASQTAAVRAAAVAAGGARPWHRGPPGWGLRRVRVSSRRREAWRAPWPAVPPARMASASDSASADASLMDGRGQRSALAPSVKPASACPSFITPQFGRTSLIAEEAEQVAIGARARALS